MQGTELPEPEAVDGLTIAEVAAHLGKTRYVVSRLIRKRQLVAVKVRGRGRDGAKRITRDSYQAYLDRQAVPVEQP